jgi:hypothetical protein
MDDEYMENEEEDEENEDAYYDIKELTPPLPKRKYHRKFAVGYFDEFRRIPIQTLFLHVYEYMPSSRIDIKDIDVTKENYINNRTKIMHQFRYDTVPTILLNIENIAFNITTFNEYVLISPTKHSRNLSFGGHI